LQEQQSNDHELLTENLAKRRLQTEASTISSEGPHPYGSGIPYNPLPVQLPQLYAIHLRSGTFSFPGPQIYAKVGQSINESFVKTFARDLDIFNLSDSQKSTISLMSYNEKDMLRTILHKKIREKYDQMMTEEEDPNVTKPDKTVFLYRHNKYIQKNLGL
jgi:hypothetical protein